MGLTHEMSYAADSIRDSIRIRIVTPDSICIRFERKRPIRIIVEMSDRIEIGVFLFVQSGFIKAVEYDTFLESGMKLTGNETTSVVYWGDTLVYAVYQPPGFFLTAYTHLSDHK